MPALPEVLHRGREIWLGEVVGQIKSQDPGRSHRQGAVSGKITIQLHRIQNGGPQQGSPRHVLIIAVGEIHHASQGICNDKLQQIAPQQQIQTGMRPAIVKRSALPQLGQQSLGSLNGARHNRGKKRHIGRIPHRIPFRSHMTPVDFHHIPHGLQCVKRDARGHKGRTCPGITEQE